MTDEMWKILKDYPTYMVSNHGDVLNINRNKRLSLSIQKDGYKKVTLTYQGSKTTHLVHRLVGLAFLPNPFNLQEINHIDEDKINNFYLNLEWCTQLYNSAYSNAKIFKAISPDGEAVTIHNLNKFCKENDLNYNAMYRIVKRTSAKPHKGWVTL